MNDILLALDTAAARCGVCVFDMARGTVVGRRDPEIGRGHAEQLMPLVEATLRTSGHAYEDLSRIAVTVGPGSFTGLRVGVAAARGLALALGVPAVGVSTLAALAEPHWREAPVLAVLDAKRGEIYAALYAPGGAVLQAPAAVTPDRLPALLAGLDAGVRVVGSGAAIAASVLGERAAMSDEGAVCDIAAVARLAAVVAAGEPPKPLYLRGADAKIQSGAALARQTGGSSRRGNPV